MKVRYILSLLFCLVLLLSSCDLIMQPPANTPVPVTQAPQNNTPIPELSQQPQVTDAPVMTIAPTQLTMPPVQQGDPTPYNTMEFYSCYAFMVSYNPSNGWAQFDYFYMLKGQEAIDFLVSHEGYSQSDAEDMVNDFADGEYVCRNTNPGLRTIDLDTVPIKLMYHPDGTQSPNAQGIPSTRADVTALYNLDHRYLFDYFFFYIHCDSDGNVTMVEQVYWC